MTKMLACLVVQILLSHCSGNFCCCFCRLVRHRPRSSGIIRTQHVRRATSAFGLCVRCFCAFRSCDEWSNVHKSCRMTNTHSQAGRGVHVSKEKKTHPSTTFNRDFITADGLSDCSFFQRNVVSLFVSMWHRHWWQMKCLPAELCIQKRTNMYS